MTQKQKLAILRQMTERLRSLPAGKATSTAALLGEVELSDEDFMFDAEDLELFHEALLQQAKREHLRLVLRSPSCAMPYLDEYSVEQ